MIARLLARWSHKRKWFVYSLLISITPVLAFGLFASYIVSRSMQQEVDRNHLTALGQIQGQLDQFMANAQLASIAVASDPVVEASIRNGPSLSDPTERFRLKETLSKLTSFSTVKYEVSLIYKKYDYVYSSAYSSSSYGDSAFKPMLEQAQPKFNAPFWIAPQTYPRQTELLLFRPVPLYSSYSDGAVVIHISARKAAQFLEKLPLGGNSLIYIVDARGRIVMGRSEDEIGRELSSTSSLYELWQRRGSVIDTVSWNGSPYRLSARPASGEDGWTLMIMTPMAELTSKSDEIRRTTWLFAGGMALLWCLVAWIGSRRMSVPFQQLNNQLREQLPFTREGVLHRLLQAGDSREDVRRLLTQLGFPAEPAAYVLALVTIDEEARDPQWALTDTAVRQATMRELSLRLTERCAPGTPCLAAVQPNGRIAALLGTADWRHALETAQGWQRSVEQAYPFTISAALAAPKSDFTQLPASLQEAEALLAYKVSLGPNKLLTEERVRELRLDQASKQKIWVEQVLAYIHREIEQDVTLQQAADSVRLSVSYLSRVFKEETGTTFSDYVTHYRMGRAKEMLEASDVPLQHIAERLRYSTVQNFSRIFKQTFGVPPGEYRKRMQERRNDA
ncbi:helix-turn-helix domain-containing protein [Paenibacillus koleovorans]|uniref:helix-turn-helix domain-containing protein n=1 Tax=Paenibacillus koleovorans TaxID=121608 RepID=UPI0013E2FF88|nr:helix-turn-helix domain-containing protein [Paenibacillus koleovorans]